MRALAIDHYGANDVVSVRDLPAPEPGPRDVLIRVRAASVNPLDWKTRAGEVKMILPYRFPLILGNDLSGVVERVGAEVTRFKPGDEVYARLEKMRIGAIADFAVALESSVALKPKNISHEEAASLPLVGLTSYQALTERAAVKPGHKVLIHAGAGGVGTFAIQLAKTLGTAVATTTSTKNIELVRSLGADVVVDYKAQEFDQVLSGYDAVFDTMGGDNLKRSFTVLRRGGVLVTIGGMPDPAEGARMGMPWHLRVVLAIATWGISRRARRAGVKWGYLFMRPDGEQLAKIAELVEQGKIRPVVDRVYPFEEGAKALAHVEAGTARGKVVIKVS